MNPLIRPHSVPPATLAAANTAGMFPLPLTDLLRSRSVPPKNATDDPFLPLKLIFSSQFVLNAFNDSSPEQIIQVLGAFYSSTSTMLDVEALNLFSSFLEIMNQSMVSRLNSHYSFLIKSVLDTNWFQFEPTPNCPVALFEDAYLIFHSRFSDWVQNILSAYSYHVTPTAEGIVAALLKAFPHEKYTERIHAVIRPLIKLIPSLKPVLVHHLNQVFPHPRGLDEQDLYSFFLSECLKICQYWPEIRPLLLELIITKIIHLDVEIQVEVEDLEEDLLDHLEHNVLHDEDDHHHHHPPHHHEHGRSFDTEDEGSDLEENSFDPIDTVKCLINRLDFALFSMFSFIEKMRTEEAGVNFSNLFVTFLVLFEKVILPTMRSRYTQFVLFFICSLDEKFPDYFLGVLLSRLSSISMHSPSPIAAITGSDVWTDTVKIHSAISDNPQEFHSAGFDALKFTCAAYVGGFIARAKFITPRTVQKAIWYLLVWSEKYIEANGCSDCRAGNLCHESISTTATKTPSTLRHSTFYSISQAIIYIFCFRHRQILLVQSTERASVKQIQLLTLLKKLIFNGCLSPLRSILPSIADEFIAILGSMYPELSIDKRAQTLLTPGNSRSSSPIAPPLEPFPSLIEDSITFSAQLKALESLGNFFPFDPYRLPASRRFIPEELFIDWTESPNMIN